MRTIRRKAVARAGTIGVFAAALVGATSALMVADVVGGAADESNEGGASTDGVSGAVGGVAFGTLEAKPLVAAELCVVEAGAAGGRA